MSENSQGAISIEEAVGRVKVARSTADDDAETPEDEAGTEDSNPDEETEDTAGDETEDADSDEGEGDDAQEADDDPEIEVSTPEGARKVKLSELRQGYLRQADYTRKTQATAEERRELERVKEAAAQHERQLTEALQQWAVSTDAPPDWQKLASELSPKDFNLRRVEWENRQQRKEQARAELQRLRESERARRVATEAEALFTAVPEWRNPAAYEEAGRKVATAAVAYGFTPEEIGNIDDHRMILVLRDAAAYRELQKGKAQVTKKVSEAKSGLKPGAKPDKRQESEAARREQRARLKQTGSADDAIALLRMRRGS